MNRPDSRVSGFRGLGAKGWTPGLTERAYENIIGVGLRGKNLALACVATEIAHDEKPLTLRGLMYRVVSAGWLPSTDREHYSRIGRILTTLREAGIVPFSWIVDNVRSTNKLARHRDIKTTMRYYRGKTDEADRRALERMEAAFSTLENGKPDSEPTGERNGERVLHSEPSDSATSCAP